MVHIQYNIYIQYVYTYNNIYAVMYIPDMYILMFIQVVCHKYIYIHIQYTFIPRRELEIWEEEKRGDDGHVRLIKP